MTAAPAYTIVLDWLEAELRSGAVVVGDKLPGERTLAERFGISRASVREATRMLEAMGLIRASAGSGPNSGAVVVSEPSAALGWALRLHIATRSLPMADVVAARVLLETDAAQAAALDQGDGGRKARHLGRSVADIQHGHPEPIPDPFEIGHDLGLAGIVQRRQRLIGKDHPRVGQQRPADGDALALAPRKAGGHPVQQRPDSQHLDHVRRGRRTAGPGKPAAIQQVLADTEMRKQPPVLEHDPQPASVRGKMHPPRRVGQHRPAHHDPPMAGAHQAGHGVHVMPSIYSQQIADQHPRNQAAVDAMRAELNSLPIRGTVVIGEGERDQAPMLFIGEQLGQGEGPEVDIAVDPLEGTTLCAKDMPGAIAVMAMAERGSLLAAPDVYMQKIAIGPGYPAGLVDLDASPADNIAALARAKGVDPSQITAILKKAKAQYHPSRAPASSPRSRPVASA